MTHAMQAFGEANQELTDILRGGITERVVVWERRADALVVHVDLYDPPLPDHFDTDEWEAARIVIEATPTRAGFRDAWRAARALIAGRSVVDRDGDIVIGRCRS